MGAYQQIADLELTGLLRSDNRVPYSVIFSRYNSLFHVHGYKRLKDNQEAQDIVLNFYLYTV